jgi:hypothetical protein
LFYSKILHLQGHKPDLLVVLSRYWLMGCEAVLAVIWGDHFHTTL